MRFCLSGVGDGTWSGSVSGRNGGPVRAYMQKRGRHARGSWFMVRSVLEKSFCFGPATIVSTFAMEGFPLPILLHGVVILGSEL